MTARVVRVIERYPITTILVAVVIGFVVQALVIKQVAHDAAQRFEREQSARIAAVEDVQSALEVETRARTTESCVEQQRTRDGTIEAWREILDYITPKNADGTLRATPAIDGLRKVVADAYPAVSCPQDQGPIVLPTPTTTTP